MDILKILGSTAQGGQLPVNLKIALDSSVTAAVKTASRGFITGLGLLALGITAAALIKKK